MGKIRRFDGKERKRIVWQGAHRFLKDRPVPPDRYSTGIPSLDDAFGGGLWPISLFTVQGAPGAGKSSLGVQLAARLAKTHGCKVYLLTPDEGTRSACVRLGQAAGIDRDELERTTEDALTQLAEAYAPGSVNLVDADAPEAVIETFLEQIAEEHAPTDPPPVLYADSIQTIRTDLDDSFDGSRERIDYVMDLIKSSTREIPMIGLLVSHVNRPTFAAKDEKQRIDPLAGAAESITITRDSDIVLHLEGDLHTVVRASLRKNRLHRGAKPVFRLRYDIPRGGFLEGDDVTELEQKDRAKELAHEKTVQKLAAGIEDALRKSESRLSFRQLAEIVGGKQANVREALTGLEATGAVNWTQGLKNSVLWGLTSRGKSA